MLKEILGITGAALAANQANNSHIAQQKELMDIQAKHNKEQAKYSQELSKEMWNYTNFENQMKHIKAAGLSPGLIYGMGGQGGSSSGAGQAGSVGLPQTTGTEIGLKAQGMGLELASIISQIDLNKSQANKNNAEANKISGVDTETQKATIDYLIEQTKSESARRGLMYAQGRMADAIEELTRAKVDEVPWTIKNLQKSLDYTDRQIRATDLDNELKEKTMEAEVQKATESLKNLIADTIQKYSAAAVNREEAKAIGERVKQGWSTISIETAKKEQGWRELELKAEEITNQLTLGLKNIEQKEKDRIKDYVLGIGQIMTKWGTDIMKLPKGGSTIKGFGS